MDDIKEWYDKLNKKVKSFIKVTSFAILVAGLLLLFNRFVFAPMKVHGISMSPALTDGDIIFINKLSYKNNDPARFDIIAFEYKYDKSTWFVKRIVGMPGETVKIENNIIYIKKDESDEFHELSEYYGYYDKKTVPKYENCEPVTLGSDEYFVIGDNRNNSDDSRSHDIGPVSEDMIIGKAIFRLLPFNAIGSLKYQ